MKQKILEALKTKFVGVDAKLLEQKAGKLAETVKDEEGVKTAVDGVTFQEILQAYGDSRADEAQKSAVKNYEKKHGLKDGKKLDEGGGGDEPEWFKSFRKEFDTLKEENEALKATKAAEERSKMITDAAEKLGIPGYLMKHFTLADDADIEKELTAFKQDLVTNKLLPNGGSPLVTTDARVDAEADAWLKSFEK